MTQTTTTDTDVLHYAGIQFTSSRVVELDGSSPSLRVLQAEIKQLRLIHAARAPYPVIAVLFGLVLIALGLIPFWYLFESFQHGVVLSKYVLLLASLIPVGISPIYHAFNRRYLLVIDSSTGTRRLAFSKSAELSKIRELIQQAERKFGYHVKVSV